jgi:hypothetical protein
VLVLDDLHPRTIDECPVDSLPAQPALVPKCYFYLFETTRRVSCNQWLNANIVRTRSDLLIYKSKGIGKSGPLSYSNRTIPI